MTILILNWRDIKNPLGGGAEILTHEMSKRWVQKGHKVIQFSSRFKNAKPKEVIDGVQIIRKGKWWNVHFFAFFYYIFVVKKEADIIIDEVHWFPFFSYLYAPKKTVALVCEVANNLFYTIFPYPVAICWRLLEKLYLTVYRNVPTMVISQSTYNDLLNEGHVSSNIIVLPMGLSVPKKLKKYSKEKNPTLIYLARLNRQKGIYDVINAFALVIRKFPNAKLWIVGSGDELTVLSVKKEIDNFNISKQVKLFGFVSEVMKFELISRAHLLISASVQEGWGLTIPEAGLMQTPSVVYNTQGFRDIIEDGKNGILVNSEPSALADGISRMLKNSNLYKRVRIAAEIKAKQYSWENTAKTSIKFLQFLEETANN